MQLHETIPDLISQVPRDRRILVAIDPGAHGAMAAFEVTGQSDHFTRIAVCRIPTYVRQVSTHSLVKAKPGEDPAEVEYNEAGKPRTTKLKKSNRTEFDLHGIIALFTTLEGDPSRLTLGIEQVHPMPRDRGITGYAMGKAFHIWPLWAAQRGFRLLTTSPSVWKKRMGLSSQSKDISRMRAKELFPMLTLEKKNTHDIAEAALLGEYFRSRGLSV